MAKYSGLLMGLAVTILFMAFAIAAKLTDRTEIDMIPAVFYAVALGYLSTIMVTCFQILNKLK
ncbi:MAG: hypothetical protein HRU19_00030 [Pseudobacteriovorax sp.]|nr:hypothetical protein [Pseudobacteriovorax sp.]